MPAQGMLLASEDSAKYLAGNALVCADNIDVLNALPDGSVDLIYLDPPFQSASHYVAIFGDKGQVDQQLKDIWKWTTQTENTFTRRIPRGGPGGALLNALEGIRLQTGRTSPMAAYCVFMGRRLLEMRRVLKPTGSIYLHCDHHASHYLRIIMDAVFGVENFQNELIWKRASSVKGNFGQNSKFFGPNTDTLLFYSLKSPAHVFHQPFLPYSDDALRSYKNVEPKTGRRYRLVSMTGPGGAAKGNPSFEVMGVTRYWRYSRQRMTEMISQGLVVQTRPGSVPRRKYYLDEAQGVAVQSL